MNPLRPGTRAPRETALARWVGALAAAAVAVPAPIAWRGDADGEPATRRRLRQALGPHAGTAGYERVSA